MHSSRLIPLIGLAANLCGLAPTAAAQPQSKPSKKTLYLIPHTHWEGAVFKTREEYLEMGLPNILKAIDLLKKHPEYKFTLDQVAYFKPFLERYPEEAAAFRQFVKEGRLEIVGGMDVMPDVVKPGGEMFVRQMQYGKQASREVSGADVKVAWLVDTFGHHPQMPQLLSLAGFNSFWFCRGVPKNAMPSEFNWKGIDGTTIPAFWIPGFYGLFYGPPRDPANFAKFFEDRFRFLDPHSTFNERVGLAGVDVSEPEEYVPALVNQYNQKPLSPLNIRFSIPSEFAAAAAKRKDTPTISGDFNPVFQGTYSSRIELKQATREVEQRLLTAEKLDAINHLFGSKRDHDLLKRAWEPSLFNQTHDISSGVMTDHVYEDVVRAFDYSKRIASDTINIEFESLMGRIDTRGDGIPVVVFNGLGWDRTDVAEVDLGFAGHGVKGVEVHDSTGATQPHQFLFVERYPDGSLKRVKVAFIARAVPAMGYAAYHISSNQTAQPDAPGGAATESTVLDNSHYRVTVNGKTGAISSVVENETNWEALSGPGNVVSRQLDKGDLWELYKGLDGASFIAMTTRQPAPTSATADLTTAVNGKNGRVTRGPVFSEFTVSAPFGKGSFGTRIRLYNDIKRIDINTDLVNNDKYVRYQVQFPTSVANGRNMQEIPFGSVERPQGIEFPAQQWVDFGNDKQGVGLLNVGMPGNVTTDGTMMLSLLRSHNLGAYGFGGGYEPGMSSETGFELGRPVSLHYALAPHAGDWRNSGVYRQGLEFNHPLLVGKATVHPGSLAAKWGLLEISQPNVVLTSVKPGTGNTLVVRVFEAEGKTTKDVRVRFNATVRSARGANLLEVAGRSLSVQKDAITLDLHPYEIKTFVVVLSRSR